MRKKFLFNSMSSLLAVSLLTVNSYGQPIHSVPVEATQDLQALYKAITEFRAKKGVYPGSIMDLREIFPQQEDFDTFLTSLRNPDVAKSGSPPNAINYLYRASRPDSQDIGTVKEAGLSDVLAYTSIYAYYENQRQRGGYAVLRDTGKIEFIPFDLVYGQISKLDGDRMVFPLQPGVRGETLLTEAELIARVNAKQMVFPNGNIGKPAAPDKTLVEDNGGPEALVTFSRFLNMPDRYGINRDKLWEQFNPAQPEFSLSDVQAGSAKLGLLLNVHELTLNDIEAYGGPVIIKTNNNRIMTLAALDADHAIVLDKGSTYIVSREDLQNGYSGEALFAGDPKATSNVAVDDIVRAITISPTGDVVTHTVTISNKGTQPLRLQIDRPIPGVTNARLSTETVEPGENAILTLDIKWRKLLKGIPQSVFVMLTTNDVIRPRMQLGFKLNELNTPG